MGKVKQWNWLGGALSAPLEEETRSLRCCREPRRLVSQATSSSFFDCGNFKPHCMLNSVLPPGHPRGTVSCPAPLREILSERLRVANVGATLSCSLIRELPINADVGSNGSHRARRRLFE